MSWNIHWLIMNSYIHYQMIRSAQYQECRTVNSENVRWKCRALLYYLHIVKVDYLSDTLRSNVSSVIYI